MKMANYIYERCYFLMIGFTRPVMSLFVIYVAYLLIGSLCFIKLETTYEQEIINRSIETTNLARAMVRVLKEKNMSDEDIFWTFSQEKLERVKEGIVTFGWFKQYADKLFFAFVLISTIGYGNILPHSSVGKGACIIYTFFGLPLHVIMMRLLSFKFRGGLRKMLKVAENFYGHSLFALTLAGVLFLVFWSCIFVLIPGYVFTITDKWDYSLGVYFSFVSLSSIGLGDFVGVVSDKHFKERFFALNVILMLIWSFFGLGFFSMALNFFSYLLGVGILDKLDCKCRKRTVAKKKFDHLLELIIELNWQLVKYKPNNFYQEKEIENFKNLLMDHPHEVNNETVFKMFKIVTELRECTYDQLALLMSEFPDTPIIDQARDNYHDVIDVDNLDSQNVVVNESKASEHEPEDPVEIAPTSTQSCFVLAPENNDKKEVLPSYASFAALSRESSDINDDKHRRRPYTNQGSVPENIKQTGVDKVEKTANEE